MFSAHRLKCARALHRAEARVRQLDAFARALEQLARSHGSVLSPTAIAQMAAVKKSTVVDGLEDALDGTVLLLSHDRAFLREVATRVWWFDGTRPVDFDGPFVEWEMARARRAKLRA